MEKHELIANALRGLSIGDAVGYPLEFNRNPTLKDFENVLKSDHLVISDDTQMTLFGFESILNKTTFESSYLNWYKTQIESFDSSNVGLLSFKNLFVCRYPGNTCLHGLYKLKNGIVVTSTKSEGCGSVMRLLPFTLLFESKSLVECIDLAIKSSDITHPNSNVREAVKKLITSYYEIWDGLELDCVMADNITDIGEGWIASEAVDMAIWAYNNSTSFDELLELSTVHPGDSDSVGAIAASLWGLSGKEIKYYEKIVEKDAIEFVIGVE